MIDPTTLPSLQPAEVHLLTGPSGSGKTTALAAMIDGRPHSAACPEISLLNKAPLLDRWNIPAVDAIDRLTSIGLTDPVTWARVPSELSAGQLHRLAIADAIAEDKPLVIIDDFSAPLDRHTALAVAWSTGKTLKRLGRTAIVSTTHVDLLEDLRPDVWTDLDWTDKATITRRSTWVQRCTLHDAIAYDRGNFTEWNAMKHLHYAADNPATINSIHVLRHRSLTHPAAIAVLSWPDLASAARNLVTDGRYNARRSRYATERLNKEVIKLSRIVVAPEFRGIGLATRLIAELVERLDVRYIECSTAMGHFNRFLESAGFREVPQLDSAPEAALLDWADRHAIPAYVSLNPSSLPAWIDKQTVRVARETRRRIWAFYHHHVVWRRTRKPLPKHIPPASDERWPSAYALTGIRIAARPLFYMLGPLDPMTGVVEDPPEAVDPHPDLNTPPDISAAVDPIAARILDRHNPIDPIGKPPGFYPDDTCGTCAATLSKEHSPHAELTDPETPPSEQARQDNQTEA